MSINKILKKIFHKKDNTITCRTELTIAGIKFKFYNPQLLKYPDYTKALNKVRKKFQNKEKIRVAFIVNENSKWNAQELYRLMEENDYFEPFVLVTLLYDVHIGKDKTRNNIQENYDFFLQQGINVFKAYDENKHAYINLEKFSPDIVFYQQPWGIADEQNIDKISQTALTCYYLYGMSLFDTDIEELVFHKKLFLNFLQHENSKNGIKIKLKKNEKVVGIPKLDVYKNITIQTQNTNTIIYSCHFGYNPKNAINIGTFPWSGKAMQKFALEHPEYKWIFKPHPNLKNTLYQDKKYGKEFADKYFETWNKIGEIKEKGNYFEEFANSDMLIADSGSFLLEYIPTQKPIIRLSNKNSKTKFSDFGNKIAQGIYQVYNFQDFINKFNEIMQNNNDPLAEKRKELAKSIIGKTSASQKIIDELINIAKKSTD